MIKALVCDIDNTLADGVSWYNLTEGLGASTEEHKVIFEAFLAGGITYEESKERLIGLWQSSGKANKAFLTSLFTGWQLRDGAAELFDYARESGWQTALITGSVDLFAQTVARKLGTPVWYANTQLVFDEAGELTDYHYQRDQSEVKLRQLHDFANKCRIDVSDCLALGDSDNDVAIFQATGKGIAIGEAHPDLRKSAWKHADNLRDTLHLLKQS